MIVFGVCALGVGSLYLVPAIARSPEQIRQSGANEEVTNGAVGVRPAAPEQSSSTTGDAESVRRAGGTPATIAPGAQPSEPTTTRTKDRSDDAEDRSSDQARTGEPKASKDSEPPEPVADIEPSKVTKKQLLEIYNIKKADLNATTPEAGIKVIAGTARNMGIEVVD